jgi:protein-tyrosine phosphatase
MIDIHSHILWGLDDGAETLDVSLEMLACAAAAGTTDIVATPHSDLEYRFDPALVKERIATLNSSAGAKPTVHYGCDFHLSFDNLQDALQHPTRYTINQGPYLMIEFPPASAPANLRAPVAALMQRGVVPVITHPERNAELCRCGPALDAWLGMGCLAQVTGVSLLGRFGQDAERAGWEMLRRGTAHFVASDAHGTKDRTTALNEARDAVAGSWEKLWRCGYSRPIRGQ